MSGIVKPPVGAQLNFDHPLAQGLVGCWLMNEGSGTKVNDYSGQGNHGTIVSMNNPPIATSGWNAGPHGGALAFDGSNDFVNCGNNASVNFGASTDYSIIVSLIFNTVPTSYMSLVGKSETAGAEKGFSLRSGTSKFYFRSYDGVFPLGIYSNTVIQAGIPYCCAVSVSRKGLAVIYINGKFDVSVNVSPLVQSIDVSNPLVIGMAFNGTHYPFNGLISSVMIYNRALSAEEIAYLYHDPYCMFDPAPYQAWMQKHISAHDYYRNLLAGGTR